MSKYLHLFLIKNKALRVPKDFTFFMLADKKEQISYKSMQLRSESANNPQLRLFDGKV